jgi:lipopolysaccharide export system protein LptC
MSVSAVPSTVQTTTDGGSGSPTWRVRSLTKGGGSYTRFANSMRITLPLVAVAIVILVVAWPQLTEKPKKFSLNVSNINTSETGTQQIISARFTGTDSENRPYSVTADTASQNNKAPDMVDLAFPKADITLKSGAWLALSAETGTFNRKLQVLNLKGEVNLFHDMGYELRTAAADIFMKQGIASGNKPVYGQGPIGTVQSAGFQILDGGKRVLFTGKSRLILYRTEKGQKG